MTFPLPVPFGVGGSSLLLTHHPVLSPPPPSSSSTAPTMLLTIQRYPKTVPLDVLLLRSPNTMRCFSPVRLLDLNHDVLDTIVSFVAPADAMQLALTCRDAYDAAMPRFLSEVVLGGPSVMDGPEQITLFCRYMLADPHNRIRHLRVLEIKEGAFVSSEGEDRSGAWVADFSCAAILADMLRKATNLRKITIRDLEPLLQHQPAVAEAMSHLSRLRDLSFYLVGKCTLEMLKNTTCHPYRLEFGMWKDGPRVAGDTAAFDEYAPSLHTVNLWQVACLLESFGPEYVGEGVRVLGLVPNVRTITFAPECSVEEEAPTANWTSLDHVDTSAPLPFFSCTVRRLDLRYVLGVVQTRLSRAQVVDRTVKLLTQTKPVVLSCKIREEPGDTIVERLVPVISQVRFLEVAYTPPEPVAGNHDMFPPLQNVNDWTGEFFRRFEKVPLVGLSFAYCTDPVCFGRPVQETARLAAVHIPTLQFISIGVVPRREGLPVPTRLYFRVQMRGKAQEPLLEQLESGPGKRIRDELRTFARTAGA
ncbi:uncharacterized protein B0H18DRAFT_957844 [Fomitopsis serialis]|uniref:uncharacterized protein n=1 Tax=Fomitopsis serialis TaxID=139415 RepID=UPI00200841EE|nr:uncharacterized protein B0H18DRAFT_957844 [Neoantrodia serialis]KAH9918686.1 hypothetical protein B0H18DRAFT_957844 [Neoantrodia serialis]